MMDNVNKGNKDLINEAHKKKKTLAAVSLVLVAAAAFFIYPRIFSEKPQASATGTVVTAPRSYIGKIELAKTIPPDITAGRASIRLIDVDRWNIVDFEWENQKGDPVPVMAYISSSGRLFVGHSLCGCGGTEFFLAGEVLVCGSCRTTFTIEDQKFMSGSTTAGKNPPERIRSVIENGMIVIEQSDLDN